MLHIAFARGGKERKCLKYLRMVECPVIRERLFPAVSCNVSPCAFFMPLQEAERETMNSTATAPNSRESIHAISRDVTCSESKRRDSMLRRRASKLGLVLKKSRRKSLTDEDRGLYRIEKTSGEIVAGECYQLGADEVAEYLDREQQKNQGGERQDFKTWFIYTAATALLHGLELSGPKNGVAEELYQLKDLSGNIVAGAGYTLTREQVIEEIEKRPEVPVAPNTKEMPEYLKKMFLYTDRLSAAEKMDVITWVIWGGYIITTAEQSLKDYVITSEKITMRPEARIIAYQMIVEAENLHRRELRGGNSNYDTPQYSTVQARHMIAGAFRFLIEQATPQIGNTEDLICLISIMNQVLQLGPERFLNDEEERLVG